MEDFKLRDYQIEALNVIYRDLQLMPEVLLSAVMGAGKTLISVKLIERLYNENEGMRFLILIHKRELITQFQRAFQKFTQIPFRVIGVTCAGLNQDIYDRQITIASVQTFNNHKEKYGYAGLIIIDECHSINLDSNTMYKQTLDYLRLQRPNCRILGITATEYRLGLGNIFGTKNKPGSKILFPKLNHKIKYSTLRDAGHLVPLRGVVAAPEFMERDLAGISVNAGEFSLDQLGELMSTERHLSTAIQAIEEHCQGMDCICVVCCDISHAESLLNLLGDDATIVHSQLNDIDRQNNMLAWESGKKRIMISIKILLEGYDLPRLKAIVFLRPTMSTGLYLQAIGRVLRTYPGKEFGFLVDVTDNASRLLRNFDLDNPIINIPKSVEDADKKIREMWKICPNCMCEVHMCLRICPECDFAWPENECVIAQALPPLKEVEFKKLEPVWFDVDDMAVEVHESKKNGKLLGKVKLRYWEGQYKSADVYLWLCFADYYKGFAVQAAMEKWGLISDDDFPENVDDFMDAALNIPKKILLDINGKYPEILDIQCEKSYEKSYFDPGEDSEPMPIDNNVYTDEIPF